MLESKLVKLIEVTATPTAQAVLDVVEKVGKSSAVGGPALFVAERVSGNTYTLTEYAAIVSIAGGIMWIAKIMFDMVITYLKYRRGDKE